MRMDGVFLFSVKAKTAKIIISLKFISMKDIKNQHRLKNMTMIKNLQAVEASEADKIIEKGADVTLLYFWHNLHKMFFYPNFSLEDVHKQAMYYINRNPEFEKDIIKWIQTYEKKVKEYESEEQLTNITQ